MKHNGEIVELTREETDQVAGGLSFSQYNLSSYTQPRIEVYAQAAPTRLASLKPVAPSLDISSFQFSK